MLLVFRSDRDLALSNITMAEGLGIILTENGATLHQSLMHYSIDVLPKDILFLLGYGNWPT